MAIILAPVGSGGADGGVDVVGQNNEGGWQTIKWHIVRCVGTSINIQKVFECGRRGDGTHQMTVDASKC